MAGGLGYSGSRSEQEGRRHKAWVLELQRKGLCMGAQARSVENMKREITGDEGRGRRSLARGEGLDLNQCRLVTKLF